MFELAKRILSLCEIFKKLNFCNIFSSFELANTTCKSHPLASSSKRSSVGTNNFEDNTCIGLPPMFNCNENLIHYYQIMLLFALFSSFKNIYFI